MDVVILILWIAIYPVDSAIQLSNNRGQKVNSAFSFPLSIARKFASRERRLGTRQSLGLVFPRVALFIFGSRGPKESLGYVIETAHEYAYRDTRQDRKQDPDKDSDKMETSKETFDSHPQNVV